MSVSVSSNNFLMAAILFEDIQTGLEVFLKIIIGSSPLSFEKKNHFYVQPLGTGAPTFSTVSGEGTRYSNLRTNQLSGAVRKVIPFLELRSGEIIMGFLEQMDRVGPEARLTSL